MAETTYKKLLMYGVQAKYDALDTKDPDVLYFCTDTGKIYKGTIDFTENITAVASRPTNPAAGKLYLAQDTGRVEAYIAGSWSTIAYPATTTVDKDSDDVHVPTAKAVYDAIAGLASSSEIVASVEAGTAAATLKVTDGEGTESTVTIPGVVTKPTWDAVERKLTIPVTGEDAAVEVNFGKDIFLDPTADNGYNASTKKIELYLNDGTGETEGTKIEIPAEDLVDIYTGGTANGTSVSVSDGNVISVSLVVDPSAENILTVTENGIMVNVTSLTDRIDALEDNVAALATATTTWGTF